MIFGARGNANVHLNPLFLSLDLPNKFKKDIEKTLAKCYLAKQQGRGVSFSDVLGGIADTASIILPFLL